MGMPFMKFTADRARHFQMPAAYMRKKHWAPQIGDIFPDFVASTTQGQIRFFDWAEGSWCFLFSHPIAFSPVCTTEMIALANAIDEFQACNAKILGFTASSLAEQRAWHQDIESRFGYPIDFPTVEDVDGQFAEAFGMHHPKESTNWPIRKSFILDPQMRIRMIFEYPLYVGRSTDEVLRTIEALQAVDAHGIATPADWYPGEHYLCTEKTDPALTVAKGDAGIQSFTPYLSFIAPGSKAANTLSDDRPLMGELSFA